jgi:hypothetical protein
MTDRPIAYARQAIEQLARDGTQKIIAAGGECDPPEATFGPILARLDALAAAPDGAQAVAVVVPNAVGVEIVWADPPSHGRPPPGTKLYTAPPSQPAVLRNLVSLCDFLFSGTEHDDEPALKAARLAVLEAPPSQDAEDAARYRWLRDNANPGYTQSGKPWAVMFSSERVENWQEMERAIDAARAARGGG